jgi:CRISPR system Cascade subunit CasB
VTVTDADPAATAAVRKESSIPEIVRETVRAHIGPLQAGYLSDRPDAVAALARIRRGAGKPINAVPDLWGLTGTDPLHEGIRAEPQITRAENAVHISVTLWALHQQSRRDAPMHVAGGRQLGRAVRELMPTGEVDEPIRQRFVRVGTAGSLDVLAQRLRDIVLLLR